MSCFIVEGTAALLDEGYYWLKDENSIPSNFYCASLLGPYRSVPGKHDFDSNNNGLYGQSHSNGATEVTLDGFGFTPTSESAACQ